MIDFSWLRSIKLNARNLIGWRTDRKIIVFSVDDYGNVRIDSPKAREELDKADMPAENRFDAYDTLETGQDLEMLFETLRSVKDKNGRHAVFTAYTVPCNIDFEKIKETGYGAYHYENLPQTFKKKASTDPESYTGAWTLWEQGMAEKILIPQFHGREHLNIKVFEEKLLQQDEELFLQLENRSLTGIRDSVNTTISALAAFDFWDFKDNESFKNIIKDGLNRFETVFGYRAYNFTPPAYSAHPVLFSTLKTHGIHFIDTALIASQHQGKGRYTKQLNYTGKKENGLSKMVRNVVFEPSSESSIDWVARTMNQIEAAFRWNRPAIISSHRVNFCGHIDSKNRNGGLGALQELLKKITSRWPDVEFMAANELGALIETERVTSD